MKVASPSALARILHRRLSETGDPGRAITLGELLHAMLPYATVRGPLGLASKAEYDLALLGLLHSRELLQIDPVVLDGVARALEAPEPDLEFSDALADSLLRLRLPRAIEEAARESTEAGDPTTTDAQAESADAREETAQSGADSPAEVSAPPPSSAIPSPADVPGLARPPAERGLVSRAHEPARSAERAAGGISASDLSAVRISSLTPPRVRGAGDAPAPSPAGDPADVRRPAPAQGCRSCGESLPDRGGVLYCPRCGAPQRDRRCTVCGDRVERDWRYCVRCGRDLTDP